MEFGCHLDDDLFETCNRTEKKESQSRKYVPKACENRWFLKEAHETEEEEEALTTIKYKADLYYAQNKQEKCLELYEQTLRGAANTTVRRDCLEGVARVSLKLGLISQAISSAEQMYQESCNTFQRANASYLLATVYHSAKQYSDEIFHLQRVLGHFESNADLWLRLAVAYANTSGIPLSTPCSGEVFMERRIDQEHTFCLELHRFDDGCSCLYCPCHQIRCQSDHKGTLADRTRVYACAYRSRWLFESYQTVKRSFAEKRYTQAPEQLSRMLHSLELDQDFCNKIQKNMIIDHDGTSDDQDNNQVSFESKWFPWLLEDC